MFCNFLTDFVNKITVENKVFDIYSKKRICSGILGHYYSRQLNRYDLYLRKYWYVLQLYLDSVHHFLQIF